MATARRSRCHHCGRAITEKPVIKAADSQQYILDYCAFDDELVWVDNKEKKAICDYNGLDAAHITTKEWYEGNR